MIRSLLMLAGVALAACGQQGPPDVNSGSAADVTAIEQPADKCAPPTLALEGGAQPFGQGSALFDETKANFASAYQSACATGLLKDRALIDAKAADQGRLFLINAPDANVASIYLSEIDANRMVLEYPFLTSDGRYHVPSADELEEAIYCAVQGATPEEQESSGRCLVD